MNEGCEEEFSNLEMGGTVTALAINFDLEESTRSPWRVRLGYRGEKEIYPPTDQKMLHLHLVLKIDLVRIVLPGPWWPHRI